MSESASGPYAHLALGHRTFCQAVLAIVVIVISVIAAAPGRAQTSQPDTCDLLASSPTDPRRISKGLVLTPALAPAAIEACDRALQIEPGNLRFRNQLIYGLVTQGVTGRSLIQRVNIDVDNVEYLDTNFILWRSFKNDKDEFLRRLARIYARKLLISNTVFRRTTIPKFEHPQAVLADLEDFVLGRGNFITASDWEIYGDDRGWNNTLTYVTSLTHSPDDLLAVKAVTVREQFMRRRLDPEKRAGLSDNYLQPGGKDNRRQVLDRNVHPFSAIGKVSDAKGDRYCSASLVGNNRTLITSAHCVGFNLTHFQLASDGERYAITLLKAGKFEAGELPWDDRIKTANLSWSDWAIYRLNDALPSAKALLLPDAETIKSIEMTEDLTELYETAGYPTDVNGGRSFAHVRCRRIDEHASSSERRALFGRRTERPNLDGTFLEQVECRSMYGASGSPFFARQSDGNWVFAGVLAMGRSHQGINDVAFVTGRGLFEEIRNANSR